ncbi:MAG: Elongation factor G, partial [Candidatus Uhrbacteria bacterium GW2011_GWC2_53_7]
LHEEDPTFQFGYDPELKQTIIRGLGELHLQVQIERLQRKYHANVTTESPHIPYRETIRKEAEGEGKFIRQTGGRGQYGHAKVRIEPNTEGAGFEFLDEIKGGVIPREYINPIEKGIKEAAGRGIVAGYPLLDFKIHLFDGSYHEVDSSEAAFKIAGSMAFQDAAKKASPVLLEPMMKVEVITPEEFMGTVVGDLNAKRGQIQEMTDRMEMKVIRAFVPLSEMFGYATTVRSLTQGRASYTMEFDHYEEIPPNIAQTVVEARQGKKAKA